MIGLDLLIAFKWPLIILQGLIALVLIIMILLQSGKGDDIGSALSGSSGNQIQGTGGQSKFLVKGTAIFAILFMINSIVLAKVFKSIGTQSIGASVSEPMVPADSVAGNAVQGNAVAVPPTVVVTPAPADPKADKKKQKK